MKATDKFEEYFEDSSIFISCVKFGSFTQEDLYEIHLKILKIDGKRLELVDAEKFTSDQYFNLCSTAIDQNGLALEYVKASLIGVENYQKLCYQSVKQNGFSVWFVKEEYFQDDLKKLRVIYNTAVGQNADALQVIKDQTLTVCLIAVEKNTSALQWVNPQLFSKADYGEICYAAFHRKHARLIIEQLFEPDLLIKHIQNNQALRFVNKDYLFPEKYKALCLLAIEYSGASLPFVDKSLWLDTDFCMEAMKINAYSKNYM
ncbi:hypothetical protein FACS1894142_5020 [Spirochaetia bacterium]|nr:hypothetical protein FACS1894142_5020 [Spirochaetia bacterium]